MSLDFKHQYLNDYLAMVEETESPRIFHVWGALSAISAALGRRCWFPFGPMEILPNMYVLLVGTPGTRKSTVGSIIKRQLKASTGVRFAAADTGGQRQGLVTAMLGKEEGKEEFLNSQALTSRDGSLMALTLDEVSEITDVPEEGIPTHEADKHTVMVNTGEISELIGQNNQGMLGFLTKMWDGDEYEYGLKSSQVSMKNPLISILGCSTPTSISLSMPPAAGGQGFLSRVILVYGSRKYKPVVWPEVPPVELVNRVQDVMSSVWYDRIGAFEMTPAAKAYASTLYEFPLDITDSRFGYYNERRFTHLVKLAMALCATRKTQLIEEVDFSEAHRILRATEFGMPDALGEFGMNPLAQLKQQILENLRQNHVVRLDVIQAQFHRDAKAQDIVEVVKELQRVNQVVLSQGKDGAISVHAVYSKHDTENSMLNLLMENKDG